MTTKLKLFMVAFLLPLFGLQAQSKLDNKVLITIGDEKITVKEFIDVYNKNNVDNEVIEKKTIDEYLDLFVNFRLKVKEAENMKLDTALSFKKELGGYRKQLAKPYFTNEQISEDLLAEAYERKMKDVRAAHILIALDKHALPADTLMAYNRAIELRNRIIKGESFEEVAEKESDDPSARDRAAIPGQAPFRKGNRGDLGYFTVFDMVYPFETGAYETPVGEVSMPVRSDFGYHLIKVSERSDALGVIQAAHIFLALTPDATAEDVAAKEEKINNIYKEIQEGKDFKSAVTSYSEDRGSAQRGGELTPFTVSRIVPEFIVTIKNMKEGEISAPIRTLYGFHIVKLLGVKRPGTLEEESTKMKERIAKDSRSLKTEAAVIQHIKADSKFKEYPKTLNAFLSTLDSTIIAGKFEISNNAEQDAVLFKLGQTAYSVKDFAAYITKKQTKQQTTSVPAVYGYQLYNEFVDASSLEYEDSKLEEKYPDFAALMNEYRDGILLFDLMDKEVWSRALKDTVGLAEFHQKNAQKYAWKERVDAMIFTISRPESLEKMKKLFEENLKPEEYREALQRDSIRYVSIQRGKFEKGDNQYVDRVEWKVGRSEELTSTVEKTVVVVNILETFDPMLKTLSEAKGLITSDYQNYLEKQWIANLREKYPVVIDDKLLEKVKAEY